MISMDSCLLLSVLFVFILNPYFVESWNISKEEDLELERQLKLLNKPPIKSIKTGYGDIYDCVDFYKQPAFDHPLLKNFTFEKSKLLRIQRGGKVASKTTQGIGLQGGGCPLGSVPIKRITKEDLIREKLVSQMIRSFTEAEPNRPRKRPDIPPEIYKKLAVARTKAGPNRYQGMSSYMSIYNPQCVEAQYSAARMKMINGPDSIEVGWRVDPTFLSDDSLTRFYILTDVSHARCFNLRCPGFVVTSSQIPIDMVAPKISKLGGPIISINFNIIRDANSGLTLKVGPKDEQIGFWPINIFSSPGGLGEMASILEWGGEVFSPTGTPKPPMGSGNLPEDDTDLCAFFSNLMMRDATGAELDPGELEPFSNGQPYQVKDEGNVGFPGEHIIVYGGPGGSAD